MFGTVARDIEDVETGKHPPLAKVLDESFLKKEVKDGRPVLVKGNSKTAVEMEVQKEARMKGGSRDGKGILKYQSKMKVVEVSSPRAKVLLDRC